MSTPSDKKLPVHRIAKRSLEGSIWANETEAGVRFAVTLDRTYRTADGEWHSTKSLDRDSLLLAAEVLREASQWIYAEEERRRRERRQASSDEAQAHDEAMGATDFEIDISS